MVQIAILTYHIYRRCYLIIVIIADAGCLPGIPNMYSSNSQNGLKKDGARHRVERVPDFFSSRPNWDPLPHYPQTSVSPPSFFLGRDLACERGGGGGPNSDEGTDTVVL
jgi:hypothetical protein